MIRSPSDRTLRGAAVLLTLALAACSTLDNVISGDKVDYRTAGTVTKPAGLEVPPDLTQLARDSRYQSQSSGTVSASAYQAGTVAANAAPITPAVAPQSLGDVRIERLDNQRWLSTTQAPEQLWPQLRAFWTERGFTLAQDQADAGVMETEWAENRAKLPNDIIRNTIGKIFDSLYSTGERDKFRTRVERTAKGSEIYISHRGMVEVYTNEKKDSTVWQPRPADPQLEAEFLSRLMLKLGAKDGEAQAAAATPGAPPARARVLAGRPAASALVDDDFERAWRRVGLTLDRSGFTVEDRDRALGLYFVRYVDGAQPGKEEPGFFGKIFSFFGKKDEAAAPARYRVSVVGTGAATALSILNTTGGPDNSPTAQRIIKILVDDLK